MLTINRELEFRTIANADIDQIFFSSVTKKPSSFSLPLLQTGGGYDFVETVTSKMFSR